MREALQEGRQDEAECEAMMFDVRRFTRQEHERGATVDWRFAAGWFRRASGLAWAWFEREVNHG